MAKKRILVVEDEEDILALVHYNLVKAGYQVECVTSGEEAYQRAQQNLPDLILLDLMLPGIDGLEVCRRLQKDGDTESVPIIMLTAKGEESDIVAGLELGADDYITKPFSTQVLLARVKAVLRRGVERDEAEEEAPIEIHGLYIHPGRNKVVAAGEEVELTFTEFRLLCLLARRPGWVFTRTQIVDAIHGEGYAVTDRAVDVQVVGLRKKLGDCGSYIETVRGVGYRFRESAK
ncbi:MAG: response regulator transcription factor [Desulfuromonadales bacterium]|nr:response regulator transcription factor [Desulfuromonadales bacterium]NIR33371.1 response regulator transcription factor [Desulfuromonadales bacterium]NIS43363.1 response regulator transcription factor [Desulfuromonadales bacterium]